MKKEAEQTTAKNCKEGRRGERREERVERRGVKRRREE